MSPNCKEMRFEQAKESDWTIFFSKEDWKQLTFEVYNMGSKKVNKKNVTHSGLCRINAVFQHKHWNGTHFTFKLEDLILLYSYIHIDRYKSMSENVVFFN